MSLPQLPDPRGDAQSFLGVVRRLLLTLGHGVPDPAARAVTFNDLVDMGLVSREAADKQAREGR
ncbi:MAG: hypothetical protein HY916_09100 [Desulfovibrio sp.]|nr:hypothetical protein [Desulfovibrio sp.]